MNSRYKPKTRSWSSKALGKGTLIYQADFNSVSANAIEAEITITALNPNLKAFPKVSEIGFPCNCEGRMFTLKVNIKDLRIWMTQLALGIPVVINQRIGFV